VTQPLNYTPKAIEALLALPCTGAPGARAGIRYIADKLRQAQVFVLSDGGQLLDRDRPRPEVPGIMFKPPYPVTAVEYEASAAEWGSDTAASTPCSRRIALAWEWQDDLPFGRSPEPLGEGVAIASIVWNDEARLWLPIAAAVHLPYDVERPASPPSSALRDAMIASGRISKAQAKANPLPANTLPIMPEPLNALARMMGPAGAIDNLNGDLMDEVNAYLDLCFALACKNVSTDLVRQPEKLNRARLKAGKLQLPDFHVLKLRDGAGLASAGAGGDRSGPRSHLRRGHIRRLGPDRVTWVNQTMVTGRGVGFVDKVYAL